MTYKILYNEIGPLGTPYQKGDWKKFAIHTDTEVKGFFGDYQFLSNFWPCHVILDGISYKSVELAYQASKWKAGADREYFTRCTSLQSIEYNRTRAGISAITQTGSGASVDGGAHVSAPNGYTHDEWNAVKVSIMKSLLEQKFDVELNPELCARLLATGTKHLEEMNWWGDTFWGTDKEGKGENMLGKLLMEVRGFRNT
jgi:ribA/ribD-fused uncharacterized protein